MLNINKKKLVNDQAKFRYCYLESNTLTKCFCKIPYYGNIVIKTQICPPRIRSGTFLWYIWSMIKAPGSGTLFV